MPVLSSVQRTVTKADWNIVAVSSGKQVAVGSSPLPPPPTALATRDRPRPENAMHTNLFFPRCLSVTCTHAHVHTGGLLKLSMDENGLKEMRDNMAAAAKIVQQHHAGGGGDASAAEVRTRILCMLECKAKGRAGVYSCMRMA